jgi:transposase
MDTQQIATAVNLKAQDASYRDIAAATGVSAMTAYRTLQKDEINQLIKQAQSNLIKKSLDTAIQNQIDKISAGANITKKIVNGEKLNTGAVKLAELAHDSEKQLLQSVGIHNAHTQSIQVNNILVDNRSELSPAVEALLIERLSGPSTVMDAEFTSQKCLNSVSDDKKSNV